MTRGIPVVWWVKLSVAVGSFEVPVFTGKIELVYVVLHDDDMWPVLLHRKQVTISSVINIR
jgi:hypothetical protein